MQTLARLSRLKKVSPHDLRTPARIPRRALALGALDGRRPPARFMGWVRVGNGSATAKIVTRRCRRNGLPLHRADPDAGDNARNPGSLTVRKTRDDAWIRTQQ